MHYYSVFKDRLVTQPAASRPCPRLADWVALGSLRWCHFFRRKRKDYRLGFALSIATGPNRRHHSTGGNHLSTSGSHFSTGGSHFALRQPDLAAAHGAARPPNPVPKLPQENHTRRSRRRSEG